MTLTALIPVRTWIDDAACVGMDPELFHPKSKEYVYKGKDVFAEVRPVCANCPVKQECLDEAISANQLSAFRAGLTPAQLKRIARIREGRQ